MSRIVRIGSLLGLLLGAFTLLGVPPATAQDQTCDHLISAPGANTAGITISAPGIYCLATDVIMGASFTTGNAITINANYVTLDLNGHKIHGASAGTGTQAIGIYAKGRQNLTIKNGTVWGFKFGIYLGALTETSPAGHVVEAIRAENNRIVGIYLDGGVNTIVRNNIVANTGPTTAVAANNSYGIDVLSGGGVRIVNNDVLTVIGTGGTHGYGVYITALDITTASTILIVGNRITNVSLGLGVVGGKCRDNLTDGSGVSCTFDAGNNN